MEVYRKLGLTKYESQIYSILLKCGKNEASKISEYSKVPPTAVYPNLRKLVEKGLINEIKGNVSSFQAINPSLAINSLIDKKEKNLMDLKETALEYSRSLLKTGNGQDKKEVLSITQGKDISAQIYLESMQRAKRTFYIMGWRFEKIDDKYNMLKHLKKLVKRRVDIRIILTGSEEKVEQLIKDYLEEGIKIRYLPLDNFSIFIMDSKECKITLKDKTLPNRFNIRILDASLAEVLNNYFLKSWEDAQDFNTSSEYL
jgi:sugar-specific transcriptional regulator TrmB